MDKSEPELEPVPSMALPSVLLIVSLLTCGGGLAGGMFSLISPTPCLTLFFGGAAGAFVVGGWGDRRMKRVLAAEARNRETVRLAAEPAPAQAVLRLVAALRTQAWQRTGAGGVVRTFPGNNVTVARDGTNSPVVRVTPCGGKTHVVPLTPPEEALVAEALAEVERTLAAAEAERATAALAAVNFFPALPASSAAAYDLMFFKNYTLNYDPWTMTREQASMILKTEG